MKDDDIDEAELKGCLFSLVSFPLVAAYLTFADGWVLSKLWAWHAVPLGMRPLHWHTFAVVVLVWIVLHNGKARYKDDRSSLEQAQWLLMALAVPWVALLLGWWWS